MRKAFDGKLWIGNDNRIIAVNLGSDFCAEHEWGIASLQTKFGISNSSNLLGIDARIITQGENTIEKIECSVPEVDHTASSKIEMKKLFGIALKEKWKVTPDYSWIARNSSWDPTRNEIIAFWSESRFLFLIEDEGAVDDFIQAFKEKDIAMWLGSSSAARNGGLVIAIKSRVPAEHLEEMKQYDQDLIDLQKKAESTGIEKILMDADKKFYALSPKWKDETKSEVIFWLNPQEQEKYNYGWYGVEDLKKWVKGEGPIIK